MQGYDPIFPVETLISEDPPTICARLPLSVFDYPFFNDGAYDFLNPRSDFELFSLADIEPGNETDKLEIKGFIFHTSHCGSTLCSRMLNCSADVRVVSEPESINGLLLSYLICDLPEELVLKKLRAIIEAYRQPHGNQQYLIFKLTSWNIFLIALFQKLYPDKPWIYIDRNTEEVVNSLQKSHGGMESWWHQPTDVIRKQFIGEGVICRDFEDYLNRLVLGHRSFAERYKNQRRLYLQYPDFIDQFEDNILPHFDLKFSQEAMQKSRDLLQFDAKSLAKVKFA